MNKKINEQKCKLQLFKGTVCVDFGREFKVKMSDVQKAADLAMDLITTNNLMRWTMDDVALFWVSTNKEANQPFEVDEYFMYGERLKNGSYSLEVKFEGKEHTEELEMPESYEKTHGVVFEDKDDETNLKIYTIRVGVSFAKENRNVLGYDAEDAASILVRTAIQSESFDWSSRELISFFVKVDENENISDIENVECSIHAIRLVDRSFEITRTTNGIEEVGNAFLYEDEVTNIED